MERIVFSRDAAKKAQKSQLQYSKWFRKKLSMGWQSKKVQVQGVQIMRNEAYIEVRRSDEGCGTTQKLDLLRSHHSKRAQHGQDV